jgi:hypothetical protein
LVEPETAGDPITGQIWVRSSLHSLRQRLASGGHVVSAPTVGRLLRNLGYALRVNAKKIEASSHHPDRGQQFDYIAVQRAMFSAAGLPILSIDTKKKELVGDFKNAGQAWVREPTAVNVHDYPQFALGRAVPYGVYDVTRNRGFVCLGTSGDTPAFAVDTISAWWHADGRGAYPTAQHLLLLADAGGSNGYQTRGLEGAPAGLHLRSLRLDGDRLPLPNGVFEVESDRASPVQSDQPQLGRGAAPHVGYAAGLDPWHNDRQRLGREGHVPAG